MVATSPGFPPAQRLFSVSRLIPLVAGSAAALGFAPFSLWPLTVLSLAVLIHGWMHSANIRSAAWHGFLFGLGYFLTGVSWVYVSLHVFGQMVMPLAVLATFLFAAYLALFVALAGALTVWLRDRRAAGHAQVAVLLAPLAWTATEWLRGWLFTGFPWLTVGTSQAPSGWLSGWAPIVGVYGITWLVLLQAGMLVLVALALRKQPRRAVWPAVVLISVGAAGLGLQRVSWSTPTGQPVKVALLQGNVPQDRKWLEEVRVATLAQYQRMVESTDAQLIVLPETALPLFYDQLPRDYVNALEAPAKARGASILLGTVERGEASGAFDYFNSVVVIGAGSGQHYRKMHLVPFGEYIPTGFGWILAILKIPLTDFARGKETQVPLEVAGQKVAANICYEDAFGAEIIRPMPAATLLVNVSNVAWFGRSWAADQHFQMSQMRALETSRWMLRATNTGVTGAIDERGRTVAVLPQFETGTLTVMAQGRQGVTPYARWGDLPVFAALIALLTMMARPLSGRIIRS